MSAYEMVRTYYENDNSEYNRYDVNGPSGIIATEVNIHDAIEVTRMLNAAYNEGYLARIREKEEAKYV